MCLFPMGGGNFGPQIEGTEKAKSLKKTMYIFMIIHIGLSIYLMFCGSAFIFAGIFELLSVLILWCGLS